MPASIQASPLYSIDRQLCAAAGLLLFAGVLTLYSLSYIAAADFTSAHFYRHCIYIAGALVVFAVTLHLPLSFWRERMLYVLFIALTLCFLTLLFAPAKGAARWINIFGLTIQVSELLKFAALLAYSCWGKLIIENNTLRNVSLPQVVRPMIPLASLLLVAVAVMILQKDLGSIFILATTFLLVLVLAGMPWRYIISGCLLVALLTLVLVIIEPYRIDRVTAFIDPMADPYGKGYAQLQSLMAYSSGKWFGVGVGGSLQKELLPEAHNDFIIAIIAEEQGWLGFFAVCAVYLFIMMRAIAIGKTANGRGELFGAFYAYSFAVFLFTQITINIGGSMSVLPSKGITLPLISYGGSSLGVSAIMLAVLLRLDYENKEHERQMKSEEIW